MNPNSFRINFFEEYPTPENMAKLSYVTWPSTVIVATKSLSEFEKIVVQYGPQNSNITFGWWPIVPNSYWVSGFADPKALDVLFSEVLSYTGSAQLSVLIDLELPLSYKLYFKNIFSIQKNKRRLTAFLKEAPSHNLTIYTAEYPAPNSVVFALWKFLGVSPSFNLPHIKIPMVYSSMLRKSFGEKAVKKIKAFESKMTSKYPNRISFGLGTIATGILGNEPILPPKPLTEDLDWAKNSNTHEAFIFRLGGLTKDHISEITH